MSGVEFTAKPDYRYYAERLSQTASRITEVFGWDEKDLMRGSQQATLLNGAFSSSPGGAERKERPAPKPRPRVKSLDEFF